MRASYTIYICPSCEEQSQFAGFCDCPGSNRLMAVKMIPVGRIEQVRDEFLTESSAVPKLFIERFVEALLRSS